MKLIFNPKDFITTEANRLYSEIIDREDYQLFIINFENIGLIKNV